jgi:hypothetical protein
LIPVVGRRVFQVIQRYYDRQHLRGRWDLEGILASRVVVLENLEAFRMKERQVIRGNLSEVLQEVV